MHPSIVWLCLICLMLPTTASAQNFNTRIDRLERDVQLMQKSMYRDGAIPDGGAVTTAPTAGGSADAARLQVQIQQLEERIRQMQGRMEEVEHQNRVLKDTLGRFQQDVEMRFNDASTAAMSGEETLTDLPTDDTSTATATPAAATTTTANTAATTATLSEEQVLKLPTRTTANNGTPQFASAREQYNHAFRLLTQTEYDQAGNAFEGFIQQHPNDPLVGNAYYWAGETQYVRQNFVKAADYFRQGYESLPEGPKAGDNLLKLAMSLSAVEQNDKACVVLNQVLSKFGSNSVTLSQKAKAERNRIGCK